MKLKFNDYLAVALSREHAMNNPVLPKTEIFCFSKSNNVYTYSVAMITKKCFHLLPQMNSIIRRVLEFGLLEKWAKDNSAATLKLIQNSDEGNGDGLVVLTVAHITGAIIIMFVGYAAAFVAFIGEIIIGKKLLFANQIWIWSLLDKFFDANQYF